MRTHINEEHRKDSPAHYSFSYWMLNAQDKSEKEVRKTHHSIYPKDWWIFIQKKNWTQIKVLGEDRLIKVYQAFLVAIIYSKKLTLSLKYISLLHTNVSKVAPLENWLIDLITNINNWQYSNFFFVFCNHLQTYKGSRKRTIVVGIPFWCI